MQRNGTRPQVTDFIELDGVKLTFSDIWSVVNEFYGRVAVDPMLAEPFGSVKDWPHHVERLTHFWWIRLGGRPYLEGVYNPVEKHFQAGFNLSLLQRWLGLFQETQKKLLTEAQAMLWMEIAEAMGQALFMKNEQYAQYVKMVT
ncbi:MAG: group III truncated hemoglobin [Bdellovibrionia bacterium]